MEGHIQRTGTRPIEDPAEASKELLAKQGHPHMPLLKQCRLARPDIAVYGSCLASYGGQQSKLADGRHDGLGKNTRCSHH